MWVWPACSPSPWRRSGVRTSIDARGRGTMTETVGTTAERAQGPGLFARLIGVPLTPYHTYAAVAERPKWFGALAVGLLVTIACQTWFLSTDVGKELTVDQQVRAMEAFGVQVSDEMYAQMESRMQ